MQLGKSSRHATGIAQEVEASEKDTQPLVAASDHDAEDAWTDLGAERSNAGIDSSGGAATIPSSVQDSPIASLAGLARAGDFDQMLQKLESSPNLWHEVDRDGHSLLHWSALGGSELAVSSGLAAGVQQDVRTPNGQTALMWAVIRGHVAVARLLLEAKADPRAQDSLGATPLILAVQHRQYAMILLLISRAPKEKILADVDEKRCGPVHWAAYKGDLTSLKLLNYFEADFTTQDNEKMTPLHRAVQGEQGQREFLKFLLDNKVDPTKRDSEGRSCLDIAETNRDGARLHHILSELLEEGGVISTSSDGHVWHDDPEAQAAHSKAATTRRAKKEEMKEMQKKAFRYAAPTFWLVSVSLASFQYLTDLRSISWEIAPSAAMAFEMGVPLALFLFFYTHLVDPGKVPNGIKYACGVEELMQALETGKAFDGRPPDFGRLCTTTWVLKGLRTKYCTQTGACVEEFDHFCGWLNVAIGKGNHRPFIVLAFTEVSSQFCHLYLIWTVARHTVRWEESFWSWIGNVIMSYPLMALVGFLHLLTSPGIFFLLFSHLRLIGVNMTTNEMINAFRYDHFWVDRFEQRVFRNPFNKGNCIWNCVDFWWTRRRSESTVNIEKG